MRHGTELPDGLRRLDPIDPERLTAAWDESAEKPAMFGEIVATPADSGAPVGGRSRPRRRTLRLAAGLAVAAVGLVVAQGVVFDDSPAFAVRELPNGVLEITASAGLRDGRALAAELREYGIDVEVTTLAASPSQVGRVEVFAAGGGDYVPAGVTYSGLDDDVESFTIEIDPNLFTETLTLELHVAAREGEPYAVAQSVFEPGEVLGGLHCALGEPLRAEQVAPHIAELDLEAVWSVISPTDDPTITYEEEVEALPSGQVLWAYPRSSTTVQVTVLPDGVTLSDQTAYLSDAPCSPELAARWS